MTREQHSLLIVWACTCVEHVLPLLGTKPVELLVHTLVITRAWAEDNASVDDARKASALARQQSDPLMVAITRAAGHAVATAHMADHSLKAAAYALKAIAYVKKAAGSEQLWQLAQLPDGIRGLIENSGTH